MSNGHLRCHTSTGGALILHSHPYSSLCLPSLGTWPHHPPIDWDPNAQSLPGRRERKRREERGRAGQGRERRRKEEGRVGERKDGRRESGGGREKGRKGGGWMGKGGKGRVGWGGKKKDRRTEEEGSEGKTKGRFYHYREAHVKSLCVMFLSLSQQQHSILFACLFAMVLDALPFIGSQNREPPWNNHFQSRNLGHPGVVCSFSKGKRN